MARNVYEAADRMIRETNREILKDFGRLRLSKWDEVNVIREVTEVYRKEAKKARQRYFEIAFEVYLLMLLECGIPAKKARQMADRNITPEWVEEVLDRTDPVTMYRFDSEAERKAQRLYEALSVTEQKSAEIDKALRMWSKQLGQYAIGMTDVAALTAYYDAGVTTVRWDTADDEKVCKHCRELDGRVFPIMDVPAKPHWGCRCWVAPVPE